MNTAFPFALSSRFLFVLCLSAAGALQAEVKLASPFTSHLVLQRELPVPVWGSANAGEKVTVEFAGQKKISTAAADGAWRVELDPLTASSESRKLTVTGSNTSAPLQLNDVLVGEVWLASGQSNMEFPMSKSRAQWAGVENEEEELAAAAFPGIRMFTAKLSTANTPQNSVPGEWLIALPETVPGFSAIGYFFAREVHRELDVPVGILSVAHGASCAQSWVRRGAIEQVPELKAQLDLYDAQVVSYSPPTAAELAAWEAASEQARAEGKRPPRKPKPDPAQDQHNPTTCFNGMLAPVQPYAIRGVLWYQGESITSPRELFPRWNELLIKDWRKLWGRDLPFYFVQLAALEAKSNSPEVREWQAEALKIPNTAMVVTIDIGDRKDVHPLNKKDVGLRFARIALARDYGRELEYSGPVLESATVAEGAARLTFTHAAGGLVAKGGPLQSFEVASADGSYVSAQATIEGDTVVVRSDAVTQPAAVRYAWANYPQGANLYNEAGLPAAPFRTNLETSSTR